MDSNQSSVKQQRQAAIEQELSDKKIEKKDIPAKVGAQITRGMIKKMKENSRKTDGSLKDSTKNKRIQEKEKNNKNVFVLNFSGTPPETDKEEKVIPLDDSTESDEQNPAVQQKITKQQEIKRNIRRRQQRTAQVTETFSEDHELTNDHTPSSGCLQTNEIKKSLFSSDQVKLQIVIDNKTYSFESDAVTDNTKVQSHQKFDLGEDQIFCKLCKENNLDQLLQPCKCEGPLKYIHNYCLKSWIENNMTDQNYQVPNPDKFSCEICETRYSVESKQTYSLNKAIDNKYDSKETKLSLFFLILSLLSFATSFIFLYLNFQKSDTRSEFFYIHMSVMLISIFGVIISIYYLCSVSNQLEWKFTDHGEGDTLTKMSDIVQIQQSIHKKRGNEQNSKLLNQLKAILQQNMVKKQPKKQEKQANNNDSDSDNYFESSSDSEEEQYNCKKRLTKKNQIHPALIVEEVQSIDNIQQNTLNKDQVILDSENKEKDIESPTISDIENPTAAQSQNDVVRVQE